MWVFTGQREESLAHVLVAPSQQQKTATTTTHTLHIGRKDCQIQLLEKSISRKHAAFTLLPTTSKETLCNTTLQTSMGLQITDLSSRFGTIVNGTKLAAGQTVVLAPGDKLQFGTSSDVFIVRVIPLRVCTSSMDAAQKLQLRRLLVNLGGLEASDAHSCTHLVTPEIKMTSKVIHALAGGDIEMQTSISDLSQAKPIVTVQWLEAILNRQSLSQPLPDPNQYVFGLSVC